MIEIKVKIENIDYAKLAETMFPLLQKEAQESNGLWAMAVREMKNAPNETVLRGILSLLPQKTKDKLAVKLFEKYKQDLPGIITSFAEDQGISLDVVDVDITNL